MPSGATRTRVRDFRRNMSFPDVLQCMMYIEDMKDARDRLRRIPSLAHSRLMFWIMSRIVILEQCVDVAAQRYSRADRYAIILFYSQMCEITETHFEAISRDAVILQQLLERRGL